MTKILITAEEFTDRYSVSPENFNHLAFTREIIPFKWGIQTFLNFEDVEMKMCQALMKAEMAAGVHHQKPPKRTR